MKRHQHTIGVLVVYNKNRALFIERTKYVRTCISSLGCKVTAGIVRVRWRSKIGRDLELIFAISSAGSWLPLRLLN